MPTPTARLWMLKLLPLWLVFSLACGEPIEPASNVTTEEETAQDQATAEEDATVENATVENATVENATVEDATGKSAPSEKLAGSPPAPDLPKDRPLQAGFLIVDGVFNTELTAPFDIFDHSPGAADPLPGIEVFTVSPNGEAITTYEGLVIQPDYSFANAPEIDILIVPSADNSRGSDLENEGMVQWVRETGGKARYVMSLCWGAFVLAQAGLLDDHAATTFPSDLDDFAQRFPKIDVKREYSFVHDDKALTSHGGVKSFDVAMYLIDHLYGTEAAQRIGGGLLIDWPPTASQASMWIEPPQP